MFNGRILLQHRAAIVDGVFHARYFETDYAAFMTWRDAGHPGPALRNGFAMGRCGRPTAPSCAGG